MGFSMWQLVDEAEGGLPYLLVVDAMDVELVGKGSQALKVSTSWSLLKPRS